MFYIHISPIRFVILRHLRNLIFAKCQNCRCLNVKSIVLKGIVMGYGFLYTLHYGKYYCGVTITRSVCARFERNTQWHELTPQQGRHLTNMQDITVKSHTFHCDLLHTCAMRQYSRLARDAMHAWKNSSLLNCLIWHLETSICLFWCFTC